MTLNPFRTIPRRRCCRKATPLSRLDLSHRVGQRAVGADCQAEIGGPIPTASPCLIWLRVASQDPAESPSEVCSPSPCRCSDGLTTPLVCHRVGRTRAANTRRASGFGQPLGTSNADAYYLLPLSHRRHDRIPVGSSRSCRLRRAYTATTTAMASSLATISWSSNASSASNPRSTSTPAARSAQRRLTSLKKTISPFGFATSFPSRRRREPFPNPARWGCSLAAQVRWHLATFAGGAVEAESRVAGCRRQPLATHPDRDPQPLIRMRRGNRSAGPARRSETPRASLERSFMRRPGPLSRMAALVSQDDGATTEAMRQPRRRNARPHTRAQL
jgi:hypothetical protein